MSVSFLRIDDRMIHGQTVTRWSLEYPCDRLLSLIHISVFIICLVAKEIEKLCVKNTHNKVKGVVGVADNDKQGGLAVAYGVKLHFVGFHKVAQLLNVKGCKPRTAGNEDRACLLYTSNPSMP